MFGRLFSRKPQIVDRDGERHDVTVRVMSRDIPGYRAITLDISQSGVQLQSSTALEEGLQPELNFEFDRDELEDFSCVAEVVWSKQDGENRAKFNSGLRFMPADDDQIRNLSRMATILQVRSEADLRTLLDEANRVDPERAQLYSRIPGESTPVAGKSPGLAQNTAPSSTSPPPPPAPSPPQIGSQAPVFTPPPAQAAPKAPAKTPTAPGLYIPMKAIIEGYTWNRQAKTLHLGFSENGKMQNLYFPDCQMFKDEGCASGKAIGGMYTSFTSQAKDKLNLAEATPRRKHYRFIAADGEPLIDIVAQPCRSQLPGS